MGGLTYYKQYYLKQQKRKKNRYKAVNIKGINNNAFLYY